MANERMINSVSVGVVFVGGPDEYAITNDEKIHVLAEIQDGLEALGNNENDANLSWSISNLSVNLNEFTPWEGARWPGLPETFYKGFDAALSTGANSKVYLFKGSQYVRVNPDNGWKPDPGYPKPIAGNWPDMPASFTSNIDAAIYTEKNNKIYFFKGDDYVRVDPANGWKAEAGYPKPIAGNWGGFDADFAQGIDAALWGKPNGKLYFFKGDKYTRIDPNNGWNADAGYPKPIEGNWDDLPDNFAQEGIDAALWSPKNERVYMFKKGRFSGNYVRINPNAGWDVENGYPKPIGLSLGEAELLWRDPAMEQLGFETGWDGISEITEFFQNPVGTQYGFVSYFTKLPTGWFAYAGGGRVVMRKTVTPTSPSFENWTSIDSIFAHETGHIFGAPDEYSSSNCSCDEDKEYGKFTKIHNGNCSPCAVNPVPCLMKGNTLNNICDFTRIHFGWGAFMNSVGSSIYSFKNNKIYMFSNGYYLRYTGFNIDEGYPKRIEGNWAGMPESFAEGVDASIYTKVNGKIYVFKGNQYIRINPDNGWAVDAGYPKPIAGNWAGLPADFNNGIDAALWNDKDSKIYFFKGDQYVRINPAAGWAVEGGYPKAMAGNWPGMPAHFAQGIDSALWSDKNNRVYLFKGTEYIRINPFSGWNTDAGYPRKVNKNWMPFPNG